MSTVTLYPQGVCTRIHYTLRTLYITPIRKHTHALAATCAALFCHIHLFGLPPPSIRFATSIYSSLLLMLFCPPLVPTSLARPSTRRLRQTFCCGSSGSRIYPKRKKRYLGTTESSHVSTGRASRDGLSWPQWQAALYVCVCVYYERRAHLVRVYCERCGMHYRLCANLRNTLQTMCKLPPGIPKTKQSLSTHNGSHTIP